MPHVDELLGVTTLASMGLLVAVSLHPMKSAQTTTAAPAEKPVTTATRLFDTAAGVAGQPRPSAVPAATVRERT